jgi:glycosyltransferase involved in cell wall biosynthesis
MTPLRVIHVISGIDRADGGPTTALVRLAGAMARLQAEVTVFATPSSSRCFSVVEELRDMGVQVKLGDCPRRGFIRTARLRKALAEEVVRADVVHIHALWEEVQYQAASISRLQHKPFIVRPCGLLDPWSMARHRVRKRLYLELRLKRQLNAAAAIHFTTALEEERTRPLRIQAPTIVEPNGIDLDEFKDPPPSGSFRKRFKIPETVPLALFLGRLHPKKGIELLIQSFADGAPPEAVLAIVGKGDPSYEQELRRYAAACGLENRAKFVGFLQGRNRTAAYVDATVFVLPSYSENFANTIIESLAVGTPVIISDQVNLHNEIASAKVGGVVPTNSKALAAEIRGWLGDIRRRESASANAGNFLQSYDLNTIAARWLQRYRLLSQNVSGAAA